MSGIKLSPKHGVNPVIPVCFWCGKDKNEVALLGRIDKEDSEAPKNVIIDYEPCDKCKEIFNQGILIVGAVEEPPIDNLPPIAGDENCSMYPTGAHVVMSEKGVEDMLRKNGLDHMVEGVLETKKLVMPNEIVLNIIRSAKKNKE